MIYFNKIFVKFSGEKMKKILVILSVFLAICLTIGAVSADDGWSFSFSSESSISSSSNGGQVDFNNGELNIQGLKFTIPDGFKENETVKLVGEEANQTAFPGFSVSTDRFDKGDEFVVIKVIYGDNKLDNDSCTPSADTVAKQIEGHSGHFTQYEDGVSFDYLQDGKLVEIVASSEDVLSSVLKS